MIQVARTFDETDLYLQDRVQNSPVIPVAENLPATFEGQIAHGRLYLRTNLDAPTYRLYLVNPEQPGRSQWREIVSSRAEAVLEGVTVTAERLALSYLERASSRLRLTDLEGRGEAEISLPTLGSLFGVERRVGWTGALLRVLVVYGTAHRLPDRSYHRCVRAVAAGGG